jgi:uncharacterized damage-inducible protein DinB
MATPAPNLNPYAEYLQSEQALEVIQATPGRLQQFVAGGNAEQLQKNLAPNKWSVRDILCHLADCEIAFAFRLRQTLAQNNHVIQPFDQEAFAANYGNRTSSEALAAFTALRHWNILFIKSVTPAALTKPVTHPERGAMTFQTIVETMGGHDLNHIAQITTLLGN